MIFFFECKKLNKANDEGTVVPPSIANKLVKKMIWFDQFTEIALVTVQEKNKIINRGCFIQNNLLI